MKEFSGSYLEGTCGMNSSFSDIVIQILNMRGIEMDIFRKPFSNIRTDCIVVQNRNRQYDLNYHSVSEILQTAAVGYQTTEQ